ncbi:MAG: response regulator [Synergistaceae bacterium]|jgi:putative two-component system response regulator|nr:response regulator [Synergistaceae bacterium]
MKEILVVDDNMTNLAQIEAQISNRYSVTLAKSGAQALRICERELPDLILLDVEMPVMDGFETLERLREKPVMSRVPVIFLTASRDSETEVKALKSGARDFITKPVGKNILLHRIELHLRVSLYQTRLADRVAEMTDSIATSFAEMIECRDENTGGHVIRTSKYVEMLGVEMLARKLFVSELSGGVLGMMVRAAPLHDIGKIAISDRILLKPGKLDNEEFAAIKKHAPIGADILKNMYCRMPTQAYLQFAIMIAGTHHERYDGKGYPAGLSGEEIPLCGRIMAVADVYDALVDDRVYRKGMSHKDALGIITSGAGAQFDPQVVEIFDDRNLAFAKMAEEVNLQHTREWQSKGSDE